MSWFGTANLNTNPICDTCCDLHLALSAIMPRRIRPIFVFPSTLTGIVIIFVSRETRVFFIFDVNNKIGNWRADV